MFHSDLTAPGLWIYGLPGSGLWGMRSAGAPELAQLSAGVATDQPWSAWIFYGPPDQALAELSTADVGAAEGDLASWKQQMELAVRAKRHGRECLRLLNLGSTTSAVEDDLRRALPELELGVHRQRLADRIALPKALIEVTAHCLLQSHPGLLNAYLDLESWADHSGPSDERKRWRDPLDPELLLQVLRQLQAEQGNTRERDQQLAQLERARRGELDSIERLERDVQQLEQELETYTAEHLQLAELVSGLEDQLQRARWLLEERAVAQGGLP